MASIFGSKYKSFMAMSIKPQDTPSIIRSVVKAISLPHDVLSTSDRHLIELENQVQRMMEAHLAPKPSVKVVSDKFDSAPTRDIAKNSAAHVNVVSHNHQENGEPPHNGNIKDPSKLLSLKYQAQSSLGEQNGNSSSPIRVHFLNTITIIRKEDEPKETQILEPNAIESDDRNVAVKDEKTVEKESKVSKIIVEKEDPSDLGNINKASDLEDESKLGEEGEWIEYEQPIDLVDVCDESVYETLIEKMSSCSLNFDFRIEKGDPSNLKIPCMIGREVVNTTLLSMVCVKYSSSVRRFVADLLHKLIQLMQTTMVPEQVKTQKIQDGVQVLRPEDKDVIFSIGSTLEDFIMIILIDDDFRRGCESPLDLENGFYKDIDKLSPSYNWKIERLDLEGSFKAESSRTSEGVT
ncbi:hypothetical protein Tco_0500422 [Tanacetum coccineum]